MTTLETPPAPDQVTPRERERVVVAAPPRSMLATALQTVMLLLLLAVLAAVLLVLFAVASLVNVPGQVAGGVGAQLGGVAAQAGRAVSGAQQALQNATDPNHPPTGLIYDTEYSSLQTWHVGDGLQGGAQHGPRRRGDDHALALPRGDLVRRWGCLKGSHDASPV